MRRGELYRVKKPSESDPRKFRVFVIVSRQALIETRFSTVICAPVYTDYEGLSTQVPVSIDDGLKHDSSIHCDELVSLPKSVLTSYIGMLSQEKLRILNTALRNALEIDEG